MQRSNKYPDGVYASPTSLALDIASILRPPERITVTESACRYLFVGEGRRFDIRQTPYMEMPLNSMDGRRHQSVIFAGPAQSGKTAALLQGTWVHSVITNPRDLLIVHMGVEMASQYGRREIPRMHRYSKPMADCLTGRDDDLGIRNVIYKNGIYVAVGWPTVQQLSSRSYPVVILTDLDRMPPDLQGEGSAFLLASQRIKTFGAYGKVCAESSPGGYINDPNWTRKTRHEAPPGSPVLGYFNEGTKKGWYWPCPHCGEFFWAEPGIGVLQWDDALDDPVEAARTVIMPCPKCGAAITEDHKPAMNAKGQWLAESQEIDKAGVIYGEVPENPTDSYWLGGVSARWQKWQVIVLKYLNGLKDYERTGNEKNLLVTVNADQATLHLSLAKTTQIDRHALQARAEYLERGVVPAPVRFLIACVDVQGSRFVVQVLGFAPTGDFAGWEVYPIERFDIRESRRLGEGNDPMKISPSRYLEDWSVLIDQVIDRPYKLDDDSGMGMLPVAVMCDSGGEPGVTANAYNFYRRLRNSGKARRFHLVKGVPGSSTYRAKVEYPDTTKRGGPARGDIPVVYINSNLMKDAVSASISRTEPGPGYVHFAEWLELWFYEELTRETRDQKGRWINESGVRQNEALDLFCYAYAALTGAVLNLERLSAAGKLQGWFSTWDQNGALIVPMPDDEKPAVEPQKPMPPPRARRARMMAG